jgi:hypothetical protein
MLLSAFEDLTVSQLLKKLAAFCETSVLITAFTKGGYWPLY